VPPVRFYEPGGAGGTNGGRGAQHLDANGDHIPTRTARCYASRSMAEVYLTAKEPGRSVA
jgi:hypothetical protein